MYVRNVLTILSVTVFLLSCKKPPGDVKLSNEGSLESGATGDPNGTTKYDLGLTALDEISGFARLTNKQWDNAVRDTLLLPAVTGKIKDFTDPGTAGGRFRNQAGLLTVTNNTAYDYQTAARAISVDVVGNPQKLAALIPASAPKTPELTRAKAIVTPLVRRAFHRPMTEMASDIDMLSKLFVEAKTQESGLSPDQAGLKAVIQFILQSPRFIYRIEVGNTVVGKFKKLDAHEIAARLSFATWGTIPDEELLVAAEKGALMSVAGRTAQVDRLMASPKVLDSLKFFHMQNYEADNFDFTSKEKTGDGWPAGGMKDTLVHESELFFDDIVNTQKKGISEILTATYTYVNDKNAPLYKIAGVSGSNFVKKNLNPKERSGFFTQIGFNAEHAKNKDSHIIIRGVRITNDALCSNLQLPADLGGVTPVLPDAETQREAVLSTESKPECAVCHLTKINPLGFALENYDRNGVFRTEVNGAPAITKDIFHVNSKTKIEYENAIGLMKGMAGAIETHRCYAYRAMELLLGRAIFEEDIALIEALGKKSLAGAGTRDLFKEILISDHIGIRPNK